MEIHKNQQLKAYNTFGISALAKEYISVTTIEELAEALRENAGKKLFILGGGSNMLLTQDVDALVIHVNLTGIEVVWQDDAKVHVKAMAGEVWHNFVQHCIGQNYGGIENLSLIPGKVGTAPIQNIGAYGTEIKDVMVSCEAMEIATQTVRTFTNAECEFGYRESVFKNELKGRYIITSVTFGLTKTNHKINTSYGDIAAELTKNGISVPTIKDVGLAISTIRESKLPNPQELGNSGSFFKNPVITIEQFEKLYLLHPQMPHYTLDDTYIKVPAGWLIEQCGFKGKRFGDAGVHEKQALVLVNYGNATGQDILDLAKNVQKAVLENFGIAIEAEVNVV
ncbi:UDP-N-acetylenolpyruvoylglucosamine reductase [Flavobacterium akiainvivens]|uniref:UDP-N-acetylenolpyruvoylglucosamine reductase n=1 Tax=Flavobacterium akiainvivens TaxID=1202724 RepID=A0A0M8MDK9_9FLAO|nr:UDP-N-acetylmuramate dehydrogenase [Flavobacterium akiainvivens]KOS07985.1 UDP-N-acetylenolpyruvoylglucosamine reductase [Flavobacterium akiainvivens]SFQ61584.1 UDP-N-acetylmuramate dehydrogenase [Flavobacterium akiainvivens]